MTNPSRTWGGRFDVAMSELTRDYTAGADEDLWGLDIEGSIAHARMLGRQEIIPGEAADAIVAGLHVVRDDFAAGKIPWQPELEDVHTHVESALRARIGDAAGMLHTARSRNDQVALLNRMLVRSLCDRVDTSLRSTIETICDLAERHAGDAMPGYTHMQRAQPVTLGHHLLAYGEMLLRDRARFAECRVRANVLPLGSGALAASRYPLDREWVAAELGFEGVTRNSLDAVSDRDHIVEFIGACALTQAHLSRLAEEIILWSTAEFGFVHLPDAFATGSSMMPQKKNADVAELARGRMGHVLGEYVAMVTNLKGLPLSYNRDLQEDKRALKGAAEVVLPSLEIFGAMLPALEFDTEAMAKAAGKGFSLATDVADYLVFKGMPFREAHGVVGKLVRECEARAVDLNDLPLDVYRQASQLFDEDVLHISVESALAARDIVGGPAPRRVREAAAALRNAVQPNGVT